MTHTDEQLLFLVVAIVGSAILLYRAIDKVLETLKVVADELSAIRAVINPSYAGYAGPSLGDNLDTLREAVEKTSGEVSSIATSVSGIENALDRNNPAADLPDWGSP